MNAQTGPPLNPGSQEFANLGDFEQIQASTFGLQAAMLGRAASRGYGTVISLTPGAPEYSADEVRAELSGELLAARLGINELNQSQRLVLDNYASSYFVEAGLEVATSPSSWLGNKEGGASDQELQDFFEWHIAQIADQHGSGDVWEATRAIKNDYYAKEDRAIQDGRLSSDVTLESQFEIQEDSVVIGDIWQTLLNGEEGHHLEGLHQTVIAQGVGPTPRGRIREVVARLHKILPHELNHIRFGNWAPFWAREAFAEHWSLSTRYNYYESVSPNSHVIEGEYRPQRTLVHTLLTYGKNKLSPDLFTRAISSNGRDSDDWHNFSDSLDKSWGLTGVFDLTTARIAKYSRSLAAEHPDWNARRVQDEATNNSIRDLRQPRSYIAPQRGRHRRVK